MCKEKTDFEEIIFLNQDFNFLLKNSVKVTACLRGNFYLRLVPWLCALCAFLSNDCFTFHFVSPFFFLLLNLQPNGFNIEITNTNPGVVMVGVRILIGCQSLEKAPSFVEIFGRVIQLSLTRNRWFDLPFTREESLSADKKFSLFSEHWLHFTFIECEKIILPETRPFQSFL